MNPRMMARYALLLYVLKFESGAAQVVDTDLWGTNGTVTTIARAGQTLYIGGGFGAVGPCTGGGVPLDARTGAPRRPFARVAGRVTAVVSDGAGGWFIGGRFSAVEGVPRSNLAHVLADGRVGTLDLPIVGVGYDLRVPNYEFREPGINSLVLEGRTLYVGGLFMTVNGQPRNNLAAINIKTGTVNSWNPDADGEVRCIAVKGKSVYAGGEFKRIGGEMRIYLAELSVLSSAATAWNPSADNRVRALAVKDKTVYVGGDFDHIGGQPRNSLAALDADTGGATSWDAALGPPRRYIAHGDWVWPYVAALAVHGHTVYAGGSFASAGDQRRGTLVALDAGTGLATDFAPNPRGGAVAAIVVRGHTVYVGGALYEMGGEIRVNIAALDAKSGRATAWNPRADDPVEALAVGQHTVFAGGRFASVYDWQLRNGLAAIDLTTGRVTDWNPNIDGYGVTRLALIGNTVYLVGPIRSIDGQTRSNAGAVDATTGRVTSWDPGHRVHSGGYPIQPILVTSERAVYLNAHVGDPRYGPLDLAALDPVTGEVLSWAGTDGLVSGLLRNGEVLYLGGVFRQVRGQSRPGLAALDSDLRELLPWAPQPEGGRCGPPRLVAMAAAENTVFLGGTFSTMEGAPRNDLAAVHATTGELLPWNPSAEGDYVYCTPIHVNALAVTGSSVWAGGNFATIGQQPRPNLAEIDAETGAPTSWRPDADGEVHAIETGGDGVYVGGAFHRLGGFPRGGLAAIIRSPVGAQRVTSVGSSSEKPVAALAPFRPNPVRSNASVVFTLTEAASVSLAIYDLQGRQVATLIDRDFQTAGVHEVRVNAASWRAGVYFCRLEVEGFVAMGKMLVVR